MDFFSGAKFTGILISIVSAISGGIMVLIGVTRHLSRVEGIAIQAKKQSEKNDDKISDFEKHMAADLEKINGKIGVLQTKTELTNNNIDHIKESLERIENAVTENRKA